MKKILVPFDFSALSVSALLFAIELAEAGQGQVTALHVVNMTPAYLESLDRAGYAAGSASILRGLGREATENFAKVRADLRSRIEPSFRVEQGGLHQAIIKTIHEIEADLVVMGTNGSSGLTEALIGSNTEKIVRTAPVPIISIHKDQKISQIRNIVFPTAIDLEQHRFIWQLRALQSFFNAHLHLLYVKTPDSINTDKTLTGMLTDLGNYYSLTNYSVHITHAASEEKGVLKFAARMPASMIAMATHGYTGLTHLMLGSVAENVINHTNEAVWTWKLSGQL
ncbi:MAG: universal stress protein UspA [Dyadobacter sp. 50-39]|uniref:universal stress protein n=1 Tax=Dyadobacter sp. 50-39 TaxID=1895756 RepID=UPI0009649F59|nr:universal stress protein [Dyadobacter sp. 50-39]OJV21754.1 MAG: universal stress protein UspA [Dyadobacter sp. 50-39]